MSYSVLTPGQASWRPSNQMRVENTDLASQLHATTLGARIWRLGPGQANTLEMSQERLERLYPEGPRGMPEELGGGTFEPEG